MHESLQSPASNLHDSRTTDATLSTETLRCTILLCTVRPKSPKRAPSCNRARARILYATAHNVPAVQHGSSGRTAICSSDAEKEKKRRALPSVWYSRQPPPGCSEDSIRASPMNPHWLAFCLCPTLLVTPLCEVHARGTKADWLRCPVEQCSRELCSQWTRLQITVSAQTCCSFDVKHVCHPSI